MKIAFLDSQVALWIALGDKRLTPKTLAAINRHSKTEISAITIAELEMKAALGRLPIPANLRALFEAAGIEVKAFDALAAERQATAPGVPVTVAMDARRSEAYWASYDETGTRIEGPRVSPVGEVSAEAAGITMYLTGTRHFFH